MERHKNLITGIASAALVALSIPLLAIASSQSQSQQQSQQQAEDSAQQQQQSQADALSVLQAMAAELSNADTISFEADVQTEEVTSEIQKLQFELFVAGAVKRPDKVAIMKAGNENASLWSNGSSVTVLDAENNKFATVNRGVTVDELIDWAEEKGLEAPMAGLLHTDLADRISQVRNAKLIGTAMIGDTQTHHIAIRGDDLDWQVWVDVDTSLPKQIVITSKMVAAAPEHQLRLRNIKVNEKIDDALFNPNLPKNAEQVDIETLGGAAQSS